MITIMKRKNLLKGLLAIMILSTSITLTSCFDDADQAYAITAYNSLQGTYVVTGKVYSYNGPVTWAGPSSPIPGSYIASVNLTTVSPKTIVASNGVTSRANFADFVSPDYYYTFTTNSSFTTLNYDLSSVPTTNFSNIRKYVVSYTPPTSTQKAMFHIMTYYSDNPTGTGNSRIVDETFVQQ
jgi:hypothetical protein